MKKKCLIIFGTRPEAIKMAPLVKEFSKHAHALEIRVCITAQHREMLDQVLDFFEISPDYDLNVMKPGQNLFDLTAVILTKMRSVLEDFKPDFVFVHGDTTTTMAASLASFYFGAKICHVEAGLRTFNLQAPFPEEMNRSVTGVVTDMHFAPTEQSRANLIKENKTPDSIFITGNTVIDALMYSVHKVKQPDFSDPEINSLKTFIKDDTRVILVTGHRRENHGQGFIDICQALKSIAEQNPDVMIVYPVHLNPKVQQPVYNLLGEVANIRLISPLSYPAFIWLMEKSYLIITDSGGVQEEAPSLGKPVLVMRNTTERPEAVQAGTVILVGTHQQKIIDETNGLLKNATAYTEMSKRHNPYGDGMACERIALHILNVDEKKN
jgi:UDP-N-acetylglucosamine 2-epimerase (non-hydrolysing)